MIIVIKALKIERITDHQDKEPQTILHVKTI